MPRLHHPRGQGDPSQDFSTVYEAKMWTSAALASLCYNSEARILRVQYPLLWQQSEQNSIKLFLERGTA